MQSLCEGNNKYVTLHLLISWLKFTLCKKFKVPQSTSNKGKVKKQSHLIWSTVQNWLDCSYKYKSSLILKWIGKFWFSALVVFFTVTIQTQPAA